MSNTQSPLNVLSPSVSAQHVDTSGGCGYESFVIVEACLGLSRLLNSCFALDKDLKVRIKCFGSNIKFCYSCMNSEKVAKYFC